MLTACSTRNCDNDALQEGLAAGGSGAAAPSSVNAGGSGGATSVGGGGSGPCVQCPGSDACIDLSSDAMHCGVCGHACPYDCQSGSCVIAAGTDFNPTGISNDGQNLYITNVPSSIALVSNSGGAEMEWFDLADLAPGAVLPLLDSTVTANHFYQVVGDLDGMSFGFISKVPKNDPGALIPSINTAPGGFLIDASGLTVCWTKRTAVACEVLGAVGSDIPASEPTGITVDAGFVAWTELSGALMHANTMDGNNLLLIEQFTPPIREVVADGDNYYVVTGSGVWRADRNGGGGEQIVDQVLEAPGDMVIEASWLYFADTGQPGMMVPGRLFRAPVAGGPAELLYETETSAINFLAARAGFIYMSNFDDQQVLRRDVDAAP